MRYKFCVKIDVNDDDDDDDDDDDNDNDDGAGDDEYVDNDDDDSHDHRGGSRGRVQGVRTPLPRDDLRFSNTTGIPQQKKTMWFIGVEEEQETSAPPPKKKSWIRPWIMMYNKN